MKIFNNNIEIIDITVKDESYRYRTIMGENALTLTFSLSTFIEIPRGAYADFEGERYTLLKPQVFTEISSKEFEYTLILESAKALLGRYKFRDSSSKKLKFANTAKASAHLAMLVWNLNQRDSGWSVGECIDSTEKVLNFNHTYCDEALKMIAQKFDTEFEVVGKVISLKKIEYNKANPLPLSYGFGNGFKTGIKRENFDNSKAVEVLFVSGGEKNINASTYGSSELLLPKNQTLVYEGRTYISDENGYSIRRADKELFSHIEDSTDCSHIYPSRVGTISSVVVVDAAKSFYDFIDSSIPAGLDYSVCLMDGEKMTVIFQSGILEGKEFDVNYSHSTRKFEIVPQEIDGVTMPNATFKPVVGDTYAVFGISLPDAYVCDNASKTGSSWDMFREAAKYFFENEDPRYSFTGELDGDWTKTDWVNIGGKIVLGGYVSFTNEKFQQTPLLIRIVGVKDLINNPHTPQVELSNITVGGNSLSSELGRIDQNEVVVEYSKKDTIRFAKRGFRDVKEASELLKKSLLNFSGAINPITVQAMQYIAGDESLQFVFVTNQNTTTETPHSESYDPITKQFSSAVGIIQHRTLGITTLSSSHAASEFKWWNMTAFISARLSESEKSYFVYAKCSKTANTGVFVLSETAIALEGVAGYYHLLMGLINSENENDRSYSQMYGYSEWNPGRFTIKKVASPSGNTFFDLENEVIQGNIKFQSGVAVETGISNAKGEAISTAATDATNKANAAIQTAKEYSDAKVAVINQSLADLQTQSDGAVSNWPSNTQSEAPTLSNFPSNQWVTNTERDRHILDVYTNYQEYISDVATPNAGKSWKFVKSESGVYSWSLIADNNQSKAYLMSVKATAIANQKITTFSTIPNTLMADGFCYRKGDLWSLQVAWNGFTVGELLSAAQDSTSFVSSDWTKWVKYTDDTAVNNLQLGGTNLMSINPSVENYFPSVSTVYVNSEQGVNTLATRFINVGNEGVLRFNITYQCPIKESGWYSVSFKYKHQAGGVLNYGIEINDVSVGSIYKETIENVWREFKGSAYVDRLIGTHGFVDIQAAGGNWADVLISDFMVEKGNKPSEWTLAVGDINQSIGTATAAASAAQSTANTAVSNAATAQVSANTANSAISNISSDNILSASEKSGERTRWNASLTEKSGIDSQASAFGITTEKEAYDNAFQSLATYLNAGTTYTSGVPSWLDDVNLGANTTIVGAMYRTTWELMFSTRQILLNAISTKAKTLADAAQSSVDNLQIGVANLMSQNPVLTYSPPNGSYFSLNSDNGIKTKAHSFTNVGSSDTFRMNITYQCPIVEAGKYTISFWYKHFNGGVLNWNVNINDITFGTLHEDSVLNTWTKFEKTMYLDQYIGTYGFLDFRAVSGNWARVLVSDLMIVKGSKIPSTYIAPQEDTQVKISALDYLKIAFGGSAEITGGVVAANVILLKNMQGAITGGLSGLSTDNVCMWQGGTYQQAIDSENNPSAVAGIDRKDGSGHRAKGKLLWTKEGILRMLGGFIGNFSIIGGRIVGKDTAGEEKLVLSTDNIPDFDSLNSGYTTCYYNDYLELSGGALYSGAFDGGDEYNSPNYYFTGIETVEFTVPYATTIKFDRYGVGSYWFSNPESLSVQGFTFVGGVYKNGVYSRDLAVGASFNVTEACSIKIEILTSLYVSIAQYNYSQFTINVNEPTIISYQESRSKTEFGKNGFYSYWNSALVFYMSAVKGFVYKGAMDIPGILVTGSVMSDGTRDDWGAKKSISATGRGGGTGVYYVPHNAGDNYGVMAYAIGDNYKAFVTYKGTNTFTVFVRNPSGSLVNSPFEYTITGNNA